MRFILMGFSHDTGFRIFTFQGIATDQTRAVFAVKADLALIHRYSIRLQELPLLCRKLLDERDGGGEKRTFTYTEEDMRNYASDCAAARLAAAQKTRSSRKRPTEDSEPALAKSTG